MASSRRDYEQSRRWLLPVMGLLIIVVAAVAVWALTRHQDRPSRAPEASAGPSPSPSGAASTSICGLPDGPQAVPHAAPSAEWKLEDAFAYPTSSQFGPGREQGSVHSCYAHNPTGALFAAVGYGADGENPAVDLQQQLDRIFDDARKAGVVRSAEAAGKADRGSVQALKGYRFSDVTQDRVAVELVYEITEDPKMGGLASITLTMGWQHEDWRYVAPPGGPSSEQVTTLRGFTSWQAS